MLCRRKSASKSCCGRASPTAFTSKMLLCFRRFRVQRSTMMPCHSSSLPPPPRCYCCLSTDSILCLAKVQYAKDISKFVWCSNAAKASVADVVSLPLPFSLSLSLSTHGKHKNNITCGEDIGGPSRGEGRDDHTHQQHQMKTHGCCLFIYLLCFFDSNTPTK